MSHSFPTLDLSPSAGEPLTFALTRALTEADWLAPRGAKPAPLKALRYSHHQLARLLAEGVRPGEAAALSGYCASRISILQQDPAFQELISFYAGRKDEILVDVAGRLKSLTLDALDALQERLTEEPERVETSELRLIAAEGLDRIGFGKTSKSVNVSFAMTSEEINELRSAVARERSARDGAGGSAVITREAYLASASTASRSASPSQAEDPQSDASVAHDRGPVQSHQASPEPEGFS